MNTFCNRILQATFAIAAFSLILFAGFEAPPAMAVTITGNTYVAVSSQLTQIQRLLMQIQQMQIQLQALGTGLSTSNKDTNISATPSVTIKTPLDGQLVQASLASQQIVWEYNAIPGDDAGSVIVQERLFDKKTGSWGKWVTIARYDSYLGVYSAPWQPAQPTSRTKGQLSVGIRNAADTKWIAEDVAEIVYAPLSTTEPVINVLSPNGGSRRVTIDPIKVEFKSNMPYPALHYINLVDETDGMSYSLDSLLGSHGVAFTEEQIHKGEQSISVTVPNSYNLNDNHRFKIEVCVENTCDKSNSSFRIYKPV